MSVTNWHPGSKPVVRIVAWTKLNEIVTDSDWLYTYPEWQNLRSADCINFCLDFQKVCTIFWYNFI